MLIYNFQKEFLGIDDSDLKNLGYLNLSELRAQAADFADLFVKTPGFVHNFKHVHWIDFIECSQSSENANVIIHANDKNFRCTIEIEGIYLVDAPSQKAYLIYLNNLRELSQTENDQVANDVYEKPIPQAASIKTTKLQTQKSSQEFDSTISQTKATHDPYEEDNEGGMIDILDTQPHTIENIVIESDVADEEVQSVVESEQKEVESFIEDDFKLDLDIEEEINPTKEEIEDKDEDKDEDEDSDFDNSYTYDPHVASDELGLPLDLIEEFIGDFIAQAYEFKEQLYVAHDQGDEDKVKVLSHKLKGVAANLRIEDAFGALSIINTSSNRDEITLNLNRFYKMISKLSSEEQPQEQAVTTEPEEVAEDLTDNNNDDDDFAISFKDDEELYLDEEISIQDEEIPLDDEFLKIDEDEPLEIDLTEEEENTQQLYDKNLVASEIGIDTESFNELFSDYISQSKLLLENTSNSIETGDANLWKKNALKLKGMSDNMRIDKVKEELKTLVKTDDVQVAKEALNSVKASLEKISNL
ncbi:MAG: Hpt domain-containing protein [Campylobacterota bacterium]|nr:Hpt domain-containing protein [Campylobacterota bacterium]